MNANTSELWYSLRNDIMMTMQCLTPWILDLQKYIQRVGITNRTAEIVPCCTASKMSSISLVYRDPNNLNTTVKYETLPNMVIESCGCL